MFSIPRALCRLAAGVVIAFSLSLPSAHAQQLGRLFLTPEERTLLEELRRESEIVESEPSAVVKPVEDVPAVEQLTIDGLVIRSSGANSAWINGRPVTGGSSSREGVRVETTPARGGRVKIKLPSGVDTVELKPGQKIDVDSGVVVESYERVTKTGAGNVFDQLAPESPGDQPPVQGVGETEASGEESPGETGAPPGVRYPEAFLEQIRRMLKGG